MLTNINSNFLKTIPEVQSGSLIVSIDDQEISDYDQTIVNKRLRTKQAIIKEFQDSDQLEVDRYRLLLKAQFSDQCRKQYYQHNDPDVNWLQIQIEVKDYKQDQLNKIRTQCDEMKTQQIKKLKVLQNQLAGSLIRNQNQEQQKIPIIPPILVKQQVDQVKIEFKLQQLLLINKISSDQSQSFDVCFWVWIQEIREFVVKYQLGQKLLDLINKIQESEGIGLNDKMKILRNIQVLLQKGETSTFGKISQFNDTTMMDETRMITQCLIKKERYRYVPNNPSQNQSKFKKTFIPKKIGIRDYSPYHIR